MKNSNDTIGRLHILTGIKNIRNNEEKENLILFLKSEDLLGNFNSFDDLKKFLDNECKNVILYSVIKFSKISYENIFMIEEIYDEESFESAKNHRLVIISGIILNDYENHSTWIRTVQDIYTDDQEPKRISIKEYNNYYDSF